MPGARPPQRKLEGPEPTITADTLFDTVPSLANAPTIIPDPRRPLPLHGTQYIRREAIRLAIESYNDTDRPNDDTLLATAKRFAEFIRDGKTTEGH